MRRSVARRPAAKDDETPQPGETAPDDGAAREREDDRR